MVEAQNGPEWSREAVHQLYPKSSKSHQNQVQQGFVWNKQGGDHDHNRQKIPTFRTDGPRNRTSRFIQKQSTFGAQKTCPVDGDLQVVTCNRSKRRLAKAFWTAFWRTFVEQPIPVFSLQVIISGNCEESVKSHLVCLQ